MEKGLKTLIAGIVLFVVGAVIVPLAFVLPVILNDSDEQQFIIPGNTEVAIGKPGRYYLWNDFLTVFNGKSYNRSDSIPDGLEIAITNEDGEVLNFVSDTSTSLSSGRSSKNSIGFIEVSAPSRLTVSVLGGSEERVFSFSESDMMKMLGRIFVGSAVSMVLALAGVGISIWGIVKLVQNNKKDDGASLRG